MALMQDVMNLARIDIADTSSARYPDANLIRFANDAVAQVIVMRPDLNWGNYGTPYVDLATTSTFPLPNEYRRPVADFIIASTQKADDEFAVQQKGIQAMALALKELGIA